MFFGVQAILKGYLILRSTFLPRILGVISVVGGAGWLTYLYPPLAARLVIVIVSVAVLGSLANALWLIVVGVNEERWMAQATASATSIWR